MIRLMFSFFIGAILGALAWSFLGVQPIPQPIYAGSDLEGTTAPDWIANAHGQRFGSVSVLTPKNAADHSAMIYAYQSNHTVIISDRNATGSVDSISLTDPLGNNVVISVTESGEFANLSVHRVQDGEQISFMDHGMDGEYETHLGPGSSAFVSIGGTWYELSIVDGQRFVRIDGESIRVEPVDGKWRIMRAGHQ